MRLSKYIRLLCLCVVSVIIGPFVAYGGGTVKGKVTFHGELTPPEKFVFESFPNSKFCGKHPDTSDQGRRRVINPVETSTDGGLTRGAPLTGAFDMQQATAHPWRQYVGSGQRSIVIFEEAN